MESSRKKLEIRVEVIRTCNANSMKAIAAHPQGL